MADRRIHESIPVIGITVGDPAGIGPEVSLKSLIDGSVEAVCRPVLIGDLDTLRAQATRLGVGRPLASFEAGQQTEVIQVIDLANIEVREKYRSLAE